MSKWPLLLALLAVLAVRIPMITDAVEVLDSDAAVNGLALKDLLAGRLHWHYPGIHYMGVTELLLALPGALVFGANPFTLTVAPVLAYALFSVAVYALTDRLYGRKPANLALVAVVFTSTDVLFWSSFPIGGHALITFWHVAALLILERYLRAGKSTWLAGLGIWLGLGYYTYQMFLFSLVLVVPAALLLPAGPERRRPGVSAWVLLTASFVVGWLPHWIGLNADPHDVYGTQTRPLWKIEWLQKSAAVLLTDCLPKFVAGPGQTGEGLPETTSIDQAARVVIGAIWIAVGAVYYRRLVPTIPGAVRSAEPRAVVRLLVGATPPLVLAGFVLHPAVDNYTHSRYLIYLIGWWPIAFGSVVGACVAASDRREGPQLPSIPAHGAGGRRFGVVFVTALFVAASGLETYRYLREREAITRLGVPVVPPELPVVRYLKSQDDFVYLYGWYWDVYRMTFLCGESVKGVPVQKFPDRSAAFEWFDHLRIPEYAHEARAAGRIGVIVHRRPPDGRWRPPEGLRPDYHDEKYRVYVMPPPR